MDTLGEKVEKIKTSTDKRRAAPKSFIVGDRVMVRSVRSERVKWLPGNVIKGKSPSTYLVMAGSKVRFVHADHLRHSALGASTSIDRPSGMDLPYATDGSPSSITELSQEEQRAAEEPLLESEDNLPLRRSTRER